MNICTYTLKHACTICAQLHASAQIIRVLNECRKNEHLAVDERLVRRLSTGDIRTYNLETQMYARKIAAIPFIIISLPK